MSFINMTNSEIIEFVYKKKLKRKYIIDGIISFIILLAMLYCMFYIEKNKEIIVILLFLMFCILIFEILYTTTLKTSLYSKHSKEVIKYKKFRTIENIEKILKDQGYSEKQIDERCLKLSKLNENQLNQIYLELQGNKV